MEQQKKIVCTDKFSDWPSGASALPHLRDHQQINADELRTFEPLIVFTQTLVQQKLAEKLKADGFGVVHQDPRSIAEIYSAIREIGALLDCSARAEALVAVMQQGFNDTKKKAGFFSKKPRVYVEEWHNPPMVSGNWVPEVVRTSGGMPFEVRKYESTEVKKCESDGKNPPSREVSLEEVRAFDPDVIVLSICGAGTAASKELLTAREGWSELRAVKENHVFVIDDSLLNRPGPRLTEGAKRIFGWCFQVLHS